MDFNLNSTAALSTLNQSQLKESTQALLHHTKGAVKGSVGGGVEQTLSDEDKKLKEQTNQFESLLLKIMLEMAIKNDDGLYPKQPGSDIYHSMYIDQLSQNLSGSFGYSELLFNFLKDQQNQGRIQKPKGGYEANKESVKIQNLNSTKAPEQSLSKQDSMQTSGINIHG